MFYRKVQKQNVTYQYIIQNIKFQRQAKVYSIIDYSQHKKQKINILCFNRKKKQYQLIDMNSVQKISKDWISRIDFLDLLYSEENSIIDLEQSEQLNLGLPMIEYQVHSKYNFKNMKSLIYSVKYECRAIEIEIIKSNE